MAQLTCRLNSMLARGRAKRTKISPVSTAVDGGPEEYLCRRNDMTIRHLRPHHAEAHGGEGLDTEEKCVVQRPSGRLTTLPGRNASRAVAEHGVQSQIIAQYPEGKRSPSPSPTGQLIARIAPVVTGRVRGYYLGAAELRGDLA